MQNFSRVASGTDRFGDRLTLGDNIKTYPIEIEFEVASWLKIRSNRVCCNTLKCLSLVKTHCIFN